VRAYAELLATDGVLRGLIGPREVPRLWERHLLNCAVLEELVPEHASLADVGSGAGLPGVVLAITRPDLQVTLLEPLLRRATFLTEAVTSLGLGNVTVLRQRAEERSAELGNQRFDVVTARALAPLDRLAGWCLPLTAAGGQVLAMKGESVEAEVAEHRQALIRLGVASVEVLEVGVGIVDPPTRVVRLVAGRGRARR
jgi:16S rRNA (guanine527-N7)-methyltransferase